MNLLIDTTNWKLIFLLEQDNCVLDLFVFDQITKTSDFAIAELVKFLTKNQLKIREIKNFYLITGPGSYTGIRVGMTIVKTIKTLNANVGVYLLNSLLFQIGGQANSISVLDARGQKFYLGIYQNQNPVVAERVVNKQELDQIIQEYQSQGFVVVEDYKDQDFAQNYLILKPKFKLVNEVQEIIPFYIKNFL